MSEYDKYLKLLKQAESEALDILNVLRSDSLTKTERKLFQSRYEFACIKILTYREKIDKLKERS